MAGGQRAHVHPVVFDGIHTDAVSEQSPTRFAFGGIYGHHRNGFVLKIAQKTAHQFIHQARFSRATGSSDAQHRDFLSWGLLANVLQPICSLCSCILCGRNQTGNGIFVFLFKFLKLSIDVLSGWKIALLQQIIDHPLQAHRPTIIRGVNPGNPIGVQLLNFGGQDGPTATAKNLDVSGTLFVEQIVHVFEILIVPPLVRGDGNALDIFLDGRIDNFLDRAVVAQMDDLGARTLHDAAHDVDGGIVPIKKRSRRDKAHFMCRLVWCYCFHKMMLCEPQSTRPKGVERGGVDVCLTEQRYIFSISRG